MATSAKFIKPGQIQELSFIFYREDDTLLVSLLSGIVTCISKSGKPCDHLKNWRPITLSNNSYKYLSAALANRIKSKLPKWIFSDRRALWPNAFLDKILGYRDVMGQG